MRLSKEEIKMLLDNPAMRLEAAYNSHLMFFVLYFRPFLEFDIAEFQEEFLELAESEENKILVIEAFRGSAKSTIFTQSYPLWAIMGKQQKKFILIITRTQTQAKVSLANIRRDIEGNELLRADLGPFRQEQGEWNTTSLVIEKYDAKIMAVSIETSVRGLIFGHNRPQVIIADDLEDIDSVKSIENRDKVFSIFLSDIMPMGEKNTKIIVVGTRLHEDCLLMRLKKSIDAGTFNAIFRSYPILDVNGKIAWPERFKSMTDIEELKKTIPDPIVWNREFMLQIFDGEDALVHKEWIHYYSVLPQQEIGDYRYTVTGIDLAIKEGAENDFTAMVSGSVYGSGESLKIYIHPNPVNERIDFPTTVERAKSLSLALGKGQATKLIIETTGYQASLFQTLKETKFPVEEFHPRGDKRSRLALTTHLIQDGTIQFSALGDEALIQQLLGFGVERQHDDLVDAFSMLILKIMENESTRNILVIPGNPEPEPSMSRPELEKEADEIIRLWQEYLRSGDQTILKKYYEAANKKAARENREYWSNEARGNYNRDRVKWGLGTHATSSENATNNLPQKKEPIEFHGPERKSEAELKIIQEKERSAFKIIMDKMLKAEAKNSTPPKTEPGPDTDKNNPPEKS
jgi:predicted phage terminase large subunit-like protein